MNNDRHGQASAGDISGADEARVEIGEHVTLYRRGARRIWTADFHYIDRNGVRQHGRKSLRTRNQRVAKSRARELEGTLAKREFAPAEPSPADELSDWNSRATVGSSSPRFMASKRAIAFRSSGSEKRI
jgi:hypothetical protein